MGRNNGSNEGVFLKKRLFDQETVKQNAFVNDKNAIEKHAKKRQKKRLFLKKHKNRPKHVQKRVLSCGRTKVFRKTFRKGFFWKNIKK